MLIQAESGLASITGTSEPSRVGVSVVDIASGMNAYGAILAALIARERSGEGAELSISMFDAMADWMTVPLLQQEAGVPPQRIGLAHTSISPYGARSRAATASIFYFHPERPWRMRVLAEKVFDRPRWRPIRPLPPMSSTSNTAPKLRRRYGQDLRDRLDAEGSRRTQRADSLSPRRRPSRSLAVRIYVTLLSTTSGLVSYPAPAERGVAARRYGPVPALGSHSAKVREDSRRLQ